MHMDKVDKDLFSVTMICPLRNLRMRIGEQLRIPLFIRNLSPFTIDSFPPDPMLIIHRWVREPSDKCYEGKRPTLLNKPLQTGESRKLVVYIESPPEEGKYCLDITILYDGCRFEDCSPEISTNLNNVRVSYAQKRIHAKSYESALKKGKIDIATSAFIKDRKRLGSYFSDTNTCIFTIKGVKEWCKDQGLPYYTVKKEIPMNVFGKDNPDIVHDPSSWSTTLPEIYLAELKDVSIIGGHNPLFVDTHVALYDEYLHHRREKFDYTQNGYQILYGPGDTLTVHGEQEVGEPIQEGIFMSGIHSSNYFHWLVEYISRFWTLDQFPEYDHIPLIIDQDLHPNLLEALDTVCSVERKIIPVKYGERYLVHRLVVPSRLSFIVQEYREGILPQPSDTAISPIAIWYLRKRSGLITLPQRKPFKRLYISRSGQENRMLLNEREIEEVFMQYGFESVNPGTMTFHEQVKEFSTAGIIAGPTGAGFTNILWAPKDATILQLIGEGMSQGFSQITRIIGQNLIEVRGASLPGTGPVPWQCHYVIAIEEVERIIQGVLESHHHSESA